MVLCRNDFADIFLDILGERLGRPQNKIKQDSSGDRLLS